MASSLSLSLSVFVCLCFFCFYRIGLSCDIEGPLDSDFTYLHYFRLTAVTQELHDQEEVGEEDETKQVYSTLDPDEDR